MLGHLGINIPDLAAAQDYYDELMPMLYYQPFIRSDSECAYMPVEGKRGAFLFFYVAPERAPYSRDRPGLQHLAFIVPNRTSVHRVHARVVELGSEILQSPQEFPQYPPPYFATFWLDPFGIMLEAVCHHDRD